MAVICKSCGAKQGMMSLLSVDLGGSAYICPSCQETIDREKQRQSNDARRAEEARIDKIKQAAAKVVVTTTPDIEGHRVVAYLGIESVEFVIGTAIFSEISGDVADLFGARSSAFEKKLQAAKAASMNAIKYIAAEKGANAVIGVDLDYTEFSGNRVALIINGTLVRVVPIKTA
jgi:uncharacterized protein YbjQ (UPF0145 family)